MIDIPVQTLGGALAVIVWWLFGVIWPEIKVSSEVVAASVVIWQMLAGLLALFLRWIFGDAIRIDNNGRSRLDR